MSAADAGLYTSEDVTEFWKRIFNHQHVDTALEILGESVTQDLFQDISLVGTKKLPSISCNHQECTFAHSPWLHPENHLN